MHLYIDCFDNVALYLGREKDNQEVNQELTGLCQIVIELRYVKFYLSLEGLKHILAAKKVNFHINIQLTIVMY